VALIDVQLEDLRREHPEATAEPRSDGTTLITVPHFPLPNGWNQAHALVQFVAPVGFPMAQPDCFWTDDGLRLANGAVPKNAGVQTPAFSTAQRLWFSWHVSVWDASRDSLRSFVGAISNRLSRAE
jgi:hypothetical protein